MLQLKKILVPRDFSPSGEEALRYALDLARRGGAEVRLLFVEVLHVDVPDSHVLMDMDTADFYADL